jgi:glutamine amidotransferase
VIALIDYGAGNLTSVRKALTWLGADYLTPRSPAALGDMAGVIVPGVGNFAATAALEGEWRDAIADSAVAGTPLLGICVGMQWLFDGSDEAPDVRGLGALSGRCARLRGDAARRVKIPHVGWNALEPAGGPQPFDRLREAPSEVEGQGPAPRFAGRLLDGLSPGAYVYFTHSYAPPVTADCVAATTHSDPFAAAVERDNIFGVQFHPEKSSDAGLHILRNFLGVCAGSTRRGRG